MKYICTLLVCLLFSASSFSQNHISITLHSESYNCATGELTIAFSLENADGNGNTSYHTVYEASFGTSAGHAVFSGSGGSDTYSFTGHYTLGETVTISTYGISNNGAPLETYSFEASIPAAPAAPTVNLPALPLCNGVNGTMTANGGGGTYTWSNGVTGSTLTTNTAGIFTVHESNFCGTSAESAPAEITTNVTPTAPGISSSAGATLCNGIVTTLVSGASYGGYMEWATGEIGDYHNTGSSGTYSVREVNSCGAGPYNAGYLIKTASTPAAPVLNLNGTKLLCNGATQNLITSPLSPGGIIHWSTGEAANGINVNASGAYYAYEYNPDCGAGPNSNIVTITTSATPVAPTVTPAGPLVLCDGASATLTGSGQGTISWFQNGSGYGVAGLSTSLVTAGSYFARSSNACGVSGNSNTVLVSTNLTPAAPNLNVSGSITLCDGAGQSLVTAPTTIGGYIRWSNGITANSQTVTVAGGYYAYETNPSCGTGGNSVTVNITTLSKPTAPAVTPSGNQLLCNGSTTTLSSSGTNITWSNGTTGNTLLTGTSATYYTYDRNYCGNSSNSNTVTIMTATCPPPTPGTSFNICPATQKQLDAGAGYDTYLWSNGSTSRTVNVGPGTYTVTVTKYGCSATSNPVTVSYFSTTIPTITSSGSTTFCSGDNVTLTASNGTAYLWSNGSTTGNITTGNAGGYYVRVTDNNGCNTTSAISTITVRPLPTAAINGNAIVCRNGNQPLISFSGANATAPYTFTYRINGGANQTVSTISGNAVSVVAPTTTDGNFIYELVSVKESSSTTCSQAINPTTNSATVIVNPLPTATITGTTTVCQGTLSPTITLTASGGTSPYTFVYKINGGPLLTTGTSTGQSGTISVPTNNPGTFTYELVSVQDNSITHCQNTVTGTATVTVNPLPSATITGNTTICQNSSTPLITFTGSNATAPYTFYYAINGGQTQTISSLGTIVTVPVPTAIAGTYTYTLISVEESSSTHCATSINIQSATAIVNPLPTASISGTTAVCQNTVSPTISFTASGGTAPYTFTYSINGGTTKTINTINGNTVSIEVPTTTPGTFTYQLISVQESSSTKCSNAVNSIATITVNPLPRALITGSTTVCQGTAPPQVTFTGSNATAPYTFTYRLNTGPIQTVTATTNSVSVPVQTPTDGIYLYELLSITESSSTACSEIATGSATIKVNPLPTASITGTTAVCQNSFSPTVTIKGSGATAPYQFDYTINGGGAMHIVSPDSVISIAAPTNIPGSYLYSVTAVKESSSTQCSNTVSSNALVTVNQPANATIKGADTVCQYTNAIPILFSASGGTAPYTFTYRINNGNPQTVYSNTDNTVTVLAPTNIPGSYTYELVSVQESSSTRCINPVTGRTTVVIHPQPAKAVLVTPKQHLCNGESSPITIYNYTPGNIYTWYSNGTQFKSSLRDTIQNTYAGQFQVLSTSDKGCDAAAISDILPITTGTIAKPVITGYTRVCEGGKTKLLVVPDAASVLYETISWLTNNKTVNKQLSYTAPAGNYEIKATREGCRDSTLLAVTINDTIFPSGTLTASKTHIAYGEAIDLTANIDSAQQYRWDFGDGNTATTNTNEVQQHFYKASDSLTIQLNAVSERNCISQFTTWIKVDPPDTTHIPNLSMAGKLKDWNLYPVPFHDRLKVSIVLLKNEPIRIDAFSNAGQWVRSWQFKGITGENLFDLDKLSSLPSNLSYLFVTYYNNAKHTTTAYKY